MTSARATGTTPRSRRSSSSGLSPAAAKRASTPDAPITRAEFATLFARFDESGTEPAGGFSDLSGHWARESVGRAAALGWIDGYEDGTFRPDNRITRAEAMTMVNRVLNRNPAEEEDLLPDMRVWSDNRPGFLVLLRRPGGPQTATNTPAPTPTRTGPN